MMEATSTSQTSVYYYQTTRRNNPKDSRVHTRRRENLKSHSVRLPISTSAKAVIWRMDTKNRTSVLKYIIHEYRNDLEQ
jgi:hypothetical protein